MSHSLEQKQKAQKEAIGRRQFNINPQEKLIDHFNCKYKSKLSASGSLWIFKWHFCYYSNLFGAETKIRIRISEIISINPSGNSSLEIKSSKNNINELHKFVGFPSKEKRDSVIKFIAKQQITYQNVTNPSKSEQSLSQSQSTKQSSISPSHTTSPMTHSLTDSHTRKRSHSNTVHTAHISPIAQTIKPDTETTQKQTETLPIQTILNKEVKNGKESEQNVVESEKGALNPNPARFITPSAQQQMSDKQRKKRRKSSGGINYNNPPMFRLQSIYSQHSLHLITPMANSDDEGERLKRQKSRKDSGMDTLDMFGMERSLSVHSDDTHQNRVRSWSDSDMPNHEGNISDSNESEGKHEKQSHKGWLGSIFHTKATKQNKKKTHNPSASLGSIPKHAAPKAPKHTRTRSANANINTEEQKMAVVTDINKSRSVPTELNEASTESNAESKMPQSLTQYIDETYANTAIHLGSFQSIKWKPLYSDDFWSTPAFVFHEAFSEDFVKRMHSTRGSTGLKIGEWNIDDDEQAVDHQPVTYVRKSEYTSKIKDPPPFMPSKTEVYETQRFRFYGKDRIVVDANISTPNIKYGDYFIICQRYVFTVNKQDESKTHMDCDIAFKWTKKTWFEKIITSKATAEAEQGMALWCSKVHDCFPPTISKQAILIQQISNKEVLPSPKRRQIDQSVIDYFHTPQKRKDVIINEWIKPFGELLLDIVKAVMNPRSWARMYRLLFRMDDLEQRDNLITMKHGLLVLLVIMGVFLVCNMCWMTLWYWYSSSLNSIIREQNRILQQQTHVFEQLLAVLQKDSVGIGIGDCVDGVGVECNL